MGYELPHVPMDMKNWARCKRAGNLIFMGTTGAWPLRNRREYDKMRGAIGRERTVEEGRDLAVMCALSMLSGLKNEIGDLDKIDEIIKLEIYIYGIGGSTKPYTEVADAASKFFIELLGDKGRATRSITPMNGVGDWTVELDLIVSVRD